MKSLAIEHNLTEDELFKAVISLAKSADLQERVHDSLEKAMTVGPVEPSDPEVAYLKKKFRQLFSDAITGIMSDLDAIVPQGKLKKAVAAPGNMLAKRRLAQQASAGHVMAPVAQDLTADSGQAVPSERVVSERAAGSAGEGSPS